MLVSSLDHENRSDSTHAWPPLAGGTHKEETLDVASYALVSQNPSNAFLLKNWYGHGRTGGAGPGIMLPVAAGTHSTAMVSLAN